MTKNDITRRIAEDAKVTSQQAEAMLKSLGSIVLEQINNGNKLMLPRFGTFSPKHSKARVGRNPQTGQNQDFPAKNSVRFRPAGEFQSSIAQPTS